MTIFPSGFPAATELDADDQWMVSVDGAIRRVAGSTGKSFMMPAGVVDVADYSSLTAQVLVDCETTTGFTATNTSTLSLVTTTFTQGTKCVSWRTTWTDGSASGKCYYTFSTPQAIGSRTMIALDISFNTTGGIGDRTDLMVVEVADDVALTGNVNTSTIPPVNVGGEWQTVIVSLAGLSAIKSVGVRRLDVSDYTTDPFAAGNTRIDNIRFLDESPVDQALGAASAVGVIAGGTYTAPSTQEMLQLTDDKHVLDLKRGSFSGFNRTIWLDSFYLDSTGATDVVTALSHIIRAAPPGAIVKAPPGAIYRFDSRWIIDGDGVTVDFTGATLFLTFKDTLGFCTLQGARNVTLIGGTWIGYHPVTANGSSLTNVAGTPTVVGTTKTLAAQNDEVKLPVHVNWGVGSHFARHLPQQLGLADDGLGPRCYFEFSLSDSAQVASDCVLSVYDDTTSVLLESETLTLTGTPTTYRVSYVQTDLRQRLRVTVKKATATANTITITSATPYGENEYASANDGASCIRVESSSYITIKDAWIEGFGGDAIQVSNAAVDHLTVDGCTSIKCRRQGMSFNQGTDMLIKNVTIGEPGRSGMDFEPFTTTQYTQRVTVQNVVFHNTVNYALAMANWARNMDYLIENIDLYNTRLGFIFGGCRGGVMRNLRSLGDIGSGFEFEGANMVIENLWVNGGTVITYSGTNDSQSVVYTADGNVFRNITTTEGGGTSKISLVAGYRLEGATISQATEAAYATTGFLPFGPIKATDFSTLHLGEYTRQLPNTYKGIAHSSVWIPGGFNHLDDPVYGTRSLSGSTTPGNNLRGISAAVPASASSLAVTFPTRTVGAFASNTNVIAGTTTGGGLLPSTTYFYAIAPRNRFSGPGTYRLKSVTTGASNNFVSVQPRGFLNLANGLLTEGITVLRGLSAGTYTTRYDVVPTAQLASTNADYLFLNDVGTTITCGQPGFDSSYPAQSGTWTGTVNETGYEPDSNYDVWCTTNWNSGQPYITGKTTAGFTVNFPTAAPGDGSGRVSWLLVR